ncbi:MAG: hypothetical protein ABIP30_10660 [Ferruginibacter sp.]
MAKNNTIIKLVVIIFLLICSIIGFLIKIPRPLQGHDKFLHFTFFIGACLFLNLLIKNRLIIITILLFIFGYAMEYGQQLTNKYFHVKWHGRFDMEDVKMNGYGVLAGFVIVLLVRGISLLFKFSDQQVERND